MANEMRLIDANATLAGIETFMQCYAEKEKELTPFWVKVATQALDMVRQLIKEMPTVDAKPVVHGRWAITAHEEYANFRWNVTAECSECRHNKGEIYAGFFSGFPKAVAIEVILDNAKKVKLDNYCPNCGAQMDGGDEDA